MEKTLTLFDTTVVKKAALAVSGAILFGFVLAHMAGNLIAYGGREAFNAYAASIKATPMLLWAVRLVLLTSVVVHVAMMISLYTRSQRARPVGYRVRQSVATSYASATMRFTGPLLLLYIAFHIAHFTAPGTGWGEYEHSPVDVYSNFVSSFSIPWVALIYVAANLALGLHLFHGAWSMFQSLGLNHPRYNTLRKGAASALAITITVGNVSFPISVLMGIIH